MDRDRSGAPGLDTCATRRAFASGVVLLALGVRPGAIRDQHRRRRVAYAVGLADLVTHARPSCGFVVVPNPNASGLDNTLADVAVQSATDAWAVGEYTVDGYAVRTPIQHYDGTAWTTVPSPNRLLGTGRNQINSLSGITAIASDDVWAVGYTVGFDDQ